MKICSIKPVGERRVFDIEVKGNHNFVVDAGVVAHNCTSRGAQNFFKRSKPRSIVDIAALTSIYRPGPLAAHVDQLWMKHEKEPYDWGHPLINETLKETRGLLIFQEDVMNLAHFVGGFPMEKCDEVRRAIMKRSVAGGEEAKKKAATLEDDFVKGAVAKGIPQSIAKKCYENILYFSGYGFNRCLYFLQEVRTYHHDGTIKETKHICDVMPGELLLSRDEKIHADILVKVKKRHKNGTKQLVEVELDDGRKVKCTWDHQFRVKETGEKLPLREIMKRNLSIVMK